MDELRERLIARIDAIIAEVVADGKSDQDTKLEIEAAVVSSGRGILPLHKRYAVGSIDVEQWNASRSKEATPQHHSDQQAITETPESLRHSSSRDTRNEPLSTPDSTPPMISTAWTRSHNQAHSTVSPAEECHPRRKLVGGLRLGTGITPPRTPSPPAPRQLATDLRNFPKRRKVDDGPAKLRPSTIDKLIEGIWEQIHKSNTLLTDRELSTPLHADNIRPTTNFADISRRCRLVTGASRTARSIEVITQAYWVDCYDARIKALGEQRPDLRLPEHRKLVMQEACTNFEWSEKDLRNKMAVWKGYREIKDIAGWAALVFAGPGIYRFCKYRLGFDQETLSKLRSLKSRLEVAADTIQPIWRQLLAHVGLSTKRCYYGHPHDWVVSKKKDPVPLAWTYRQWDSSFSFEHLDQSVIDEKQWGVTDPRKVSDAEPFICALCSKTQSQLAENNECECFADILGAKSRASCPVQVFSTDDGRNNGLLACCTFERGEPLGEFVGLVTRGLSDVDVMQARGRAGMEYQIWQGRQGNYTRFINHSCQPNCQFQMFTWLGVQRTLIISKGVAAGKELTVDYSGQYWRKLDKICLCGEARCRYKKS